MKLSKLVGIALVVALILSAGVMTGAQAQDESTDESTAALSTTATAFVLQNLGTGPAAVTVEFRNTTGTLTKTYPDVPIAVGAAVNMDQRYASGDPGTTPFQGAVTALSDQPLGSVVNLVRTSAVMSYESYNGLSDTTAGKTARVLQVLKNVSSGGLVYNTTIAIQNTNASAATNVAVTFIPDPILNPAVGGTLSGPVSKSYNISAGGTLVIDQSTQTDPNIGTKFFGSAAITSATEPVAVVTTSDGGGQLLLAQPSYAAGTVQPIGMPSVYKNIVSLGDSYSTAFLIANMGNADAQVDIQYFPVSGTVSGKDTITIPKGTVKNVDQRTNAPSITSPTFMGAATITPKNGVPVAVTANLRGGTRYAMTYGGLTSGTAAGGKLYLPVGYKNITSGGLSWSSAIVFYAFAPNSKVRVSYNGNPGYASWTSAVFDVATGTQFDLRYHPSTAGHANFFGAMVVEVVSGTVGAIAQTRGSGGTSGDSLMAYQGLSQ